MYQFVRYIFYSGWLMSDNASEDEPTMEEILASIRRIISDESDDEALEAAPEEEAVDDLYLIHI